MIKIDIDYGKYFPLKDYYEKVIMAIDKRFKYPKKDMFICCLHEDTDPSMGIVHSKKKGEQFHCFGCNAWGNIVDLHKKVSLKYFGKNLDNEQVRRELCNIFGVDYKTLPSEDDFSINNVTDKNVRKELALREALNKYTILDFKRDFIEGKIRGESISYFNTLLINMIDIENKEE